MARACAVHTEALSLSTETTWSPEHAQSSNHTLLGMAAKKLPKWKFKHSFLVKMPLGSVIMENSMEGREK